MKDFFCARIVISLIITGCFYSCKERPADEAKRMVKDSARSCMKIPSRLGGAGADDVSFSGDTSVAGMVLIPGGTFDMGGDNDQADPDEFPKHSVQLSSFYIDATEVTNAQFKKFTDATGYVTVAEKKPDWEQLKANLPPGTAKPPDSVLVPSSLVFKPSAGAVDLNDYNQWWNWVKGADWRHP